MDIEQPWIEEWVRTPQGFTIPPEGVAMIRQQPAWGRDMIRKFPPWCVVRSLSPDLLIPAQGTCGIVIGYGRPTPASPEGIIFVVQHPEAQLRGPCPASLLEVVHYVDAIRPADVDRILGGTQ